MANSGYKVFNPNNDKGMNVNTPITSLPIDMRMYIRKYFEEHVSEQYQDMKLVESWRQQLTPIADLENYDLDVAPIMDKWAITESFNPREVGTKKAAWVALGNNNEQAIVLTTLVKDETSVCGHRWDVKAYKYSNHETNWVDVSIGDVLPNESLQHAQQVRDIEKMLDGNHRGLNLSTTEALVGSEAEVTRVDFDKAADIVNNAAEPLCIGIYSGANQLCADTADFLRRCGKTKFPALTSINNNPCIEKIVDLGEKAPVFSGFIYEELDVNNASYEYPATGFISVTEIVPEAGEKTPDILKDIEALMVSKDGMRLPYFIVDDHFDYEDDDYQVEYVTIYTTIDVVKNRLTMPSNSESIAANLLFDLRQAASCISYYKYDWIDDVERMANINWEQYDRENLANRFETFPHPHDFEVKQDEYRWSDWDIGSHIAITEHNQNEWSFIGDYRGAPVAGCYGKSFKEVYERAFEAFNKSAARRGMPEFAINNQRDALSPYKSIEELVDREGAIKKPYSKNTPITHKAQNCNDGFNARSVANRI